MKDHLQRLIDGAPREGLKERLAREYLQARILQGFQEDGVFTRWAFVGGTALRFLYSLPRFSEELDFSALKPARVQDTGFRAALMRARSVFEAEGYEVVVKAKKHAGAVESAFVRYPGLPYEVGLSPHPSHVLSIKVEVDTNPPAGAVTETTLVRRHVALNLHHHDKASLLAGKMHAVLSRGWAKGRDIYDLIWYLADRDWPPPNLALLNAALLQTAWGGQFPITEKSWPSILRDHFLSLDWDQVRADVAPFLEREGDVDILSPATVDGLLRSRS
jgi:hypothetical protein